MKIIIDNDTCVDFCLFIFLSAPKAEFNKFCNVMNFGSMWIYLVWFIPSELYMNFFFDP